MPWPDRIYEGLYRTSAESDKKDKIPRFYSTQMQVMINSLNHMPLSENKVSGSHGISVLMANSLMFQRFPTHKGYEDPQLSNFYGQALPFIKQGIPVNIVHLENVAYPETWNDTKILLMSYSNMKPLSDKFHSYIVDWVKSGGILVYCGRDNDPFQSVPEWWNQDENKYERASDHLFELLGLNSFPNEGQYKYGKGIIYVLRNDPKEFILEKDTDLKLLNVVKRLYEKDGSSMELKNNFSLSRGPYEIVSVLDESVTNDAYVLSGLFVDLFDPQIPILTQKIVKPGSQAYLFNIEKVENRMKPQVLASASRIYNEKTTKKSYSFLSKSPLNTSNVMRVLLPNTPKRCFITDTEMNPLTDAKWEWNSLSKTCKITFENDPEGTIVNIQW